MLTVADLQRPDMIAIDSLSARHLEELVFHRIAEPTILAVYHGDDLLDRLARVVRREGGKAPSLHRISLVLDQRLVRKICSNCRDAMEPAEEELERLTESKLHNDQHRYFQGAGCVECGQTGVSGVVPIFEALSCSRELLEGLSGQRLDWAVRERALRSSLAWSYRSFARLLISQGVIDPLEGLRMFAPVTENKQSQ
jgi:type IV pilus assembly protein PilB